VAVSPSTAAAAARLLAFALRRPGRLLLSLHDGGLLLGRPGNLRWRPLPAFALLRAPFALALTLTVALALTLPITAAFALAVTGLPVAALLQASLLGPLAATFVAPAFAPLATVASVAASAAVLATLLVAPAFTRSSRRLLRASGLRRRLRRRHDRGRGFEQAKKPR
jgi:hypothetical protein